MKKFYLANGEEVKIGDTIHKSGEINHPIFGTGKAVEEILVTKKSLSELIDRGIVTVRHISDNSNNSNAKTEEEIPATTEGGVPVELEFYIQKIADRLGWKIEKVYNYLNNVDAILPSAAFSMVLREIAIELDKKYKDHINDSPEIYVISLLNGKITKATKAHIKNYRNFAAFRSIDDARIACRITKDILKEMFKSGE